MDSHPHLVFVYGSSRRGSSGSCVVRGRFVGDAAVQGYWLYELCALGRSYAVPSHANRPDPAPLSGEIYEVDEECLMELDQLHELEAGLYDRIKVQASLGNGQVVEAWIYEGAKIAPVRVESGDWAHRGVECGKA